MKSIFPFCKRVEASKSVPQIGIAPASNAALIDQFSFRRNVHYFKIFYSNKPGAIQNRWALQPEQFRGLMYYIFERGNTSSPGQFLHDIATQTQDYREDVMTIAEQLRQEGELKGKQEGYQLGQQDGEQKGYQLGRQDATRQLAKQLLANGVERSIVKASTGLSDKELDGEIRA